MTATHYARLAGVDGNRARITVETSTGHTTDIVGVIIIGGFDTPDILGRAKARLADSGFHADSDWADVTPNGGAHPQFLVPMGLTR